MTEPKQYPSVGVITATTGKGCLREAFMSVRDQRGYTGTITHHLVYDGPEAGARQLIFEGRRDPEKLTTFILPEATGKNDYLCHRIYSALPLLVNQDYLMFLDDDNQFTRDHISTMMNFILDNNLHWAHSLRIIVDEYGNEIPDNCESLGDVTGWRNYRLVDTNCFCVKRELLTQVSYLMHRQTRRPGVEEADRILSRILMTTPGVRFGGTGKHTVRYHLGSNDYSVKKEFFIEGNKLMKTQPTQYTKEVQ